MSSRARQHYAPEPRLLRVLRACICIAAAAAIGALAAQGV